MNTESDFYIGYLPKAPANLRSFVRRMVLLLGLLAMTLATIFAIGQMPFAASYFDFGKSRSFQGTLIAHPDPTLLVARPGQVEREHSTSEYLLVAPGKHGADELVRSFAGKTVRLRGQLIYRDGKTMVEIEHGSIRQLDSDTNSQVLTQSLGALTVTGEIVDSKCYLGVMNPGSGKVHRDCASRCLSGGIPPVFVDSKNGRQFILVSEGERALPYEFLNEFVAEPVTVHGELLQRGDTQLLKIDPHQLRHTD